jgi:hypothetical protein
MTTTSQQKELIAFRDLIKNTSCEINEYDIRRVQNLTREYYGEIPSDLDSATLKNVLLEINACRDAIAFAEKKTFIQAWNECLYFGWLAFLIDEVFYYEKAQQIHTKIKEEKENFIKDYARRNDIGFNSSNILFLNKIALSGENAREYLEEKVLANLSAIKKHVDTRELIGAMLLFTIEPMTTR